MRYSMFAQSIHKASCLTILLLLCGFFASSCSQDDHSVHLSFKYTPGESYVYEMADDVTYETTEQDGAVTRVLHQQKQKSEIKVLEPDSVQNIYNLLVSFVVVADTFVYPDNFEGKKEKTSEELIGRVDKYTLSMRHDGEIVYAKGRNDSATEYYESAYKTRQPVFPDKEIQPGYKWKHTIYLSIPDNEPIPVVIKYKFTGFGKVDEYQCAIIEYFSQFEKSSDMTATKWNEKNQFREWSAHYKTQSEGKLYFAFRKGIVAKTVATISMETEYDIVEKDGTASKFFRKTIDEERLHLVEIKTDSVSLSNSKIFY
ncbi:MAG: hypothetical protein H6695_20700 [Deferribacteres bacterium]|nr:hypothetical protein [Deferribacteres bacterium]